MDLEVLLFRPVRGAVRGLLRSPGYSTTAILSVAGAIGLCCSMYAVVVASFFTAPAFEAPEQIVQFWQTADPSSSQPQHYVQPVRMEEWVLDTPFRTLEQVAATGMGPILVVRGSDGATRVTSAPVLGDWFNLLGVPAAEGRVLTPGDLRPGAEPAAVVSDAFRRAHLPDGDLGTVVLSGVTFTVVGVMPQTFEGERRVWVAVESLPEALRPGAYAGLGRLRAGFSPSDAAAEVERLARLQVEADSARYAGLGATTQPLGELSRRGEKPALWMLAGVVLAVLLVALNNLTVLTLVRAQSRSASLAIKASLGASKWELGRGPATEGLLIGLVGAVLGIGLAVWGKDIAWSFIRGPWARPTLDLGTVAVALALGGLTAAMIGLEPMRRLGAMDLQGMLQRRSAGADGTPRERRVRQILVAVQVTACVLLLSVANVLTAAYRAFGSLEMGADVERVIEIFPDWEVADLGSRDQWGTAERLATRLEAFTGLEGVTAWRQVGEDYPPRPDIDPVIEGVTHELDSRNRLYRYDEVRPGFFEVLGIDLLRGRGFTEADGQGGPPVAVVSKRAAELWWPGEDPLGRQIKLGQAGAWMTVVGVSADMYGLTELGRSGAIRQRHNPALFIPAGQFATPPQGWREFACCAGVRIGARAAKPGGEITRTVRQMVAQEAPDLPLLRVSSIHDAQMDGYVGRSILDLGRLVGLGVLIALSLSLIGIAGVASEAVHRRTREIAVRVALGARAAQVMWAVGRESVLTAVTGLGVGLALLVVLREWMTKVVFEVYVQWLAPDVLSAEVLGVTVSIMLVAVLVATQWVARRALWVSPAEALRAD